MDTDINRDNPGHPWMCILDAAPVHVGAEFRNELRKAVPHIFLVFVSAGYTSVCQPLDVAVMRPFKAALQRACVEDFASSVLEAGAGYKVNSSLATNKPKLPHWVATALEHVSGMEGVHAQAWEFLNKAPKAEVTEQSIKNAAHGLLFWKGR
eukprot:4296507-Amphidinium_carterae.1